MPRYGPLGDAPNPVQRAFVRWKAAAPIFFGSTMGAFMVFLFAFPAAGGDVSWLAVGIIGAVTFLVSTAVMYFAEGNHRSTREQRAARWAPYMPWFTRGRRASPMDPSQRNAPAPERQPTRRKTVPLGEAPNPVQRLAVRHTTIAYVIGGTIAATCVAAPMWSRSIWWGLAIAATGAGVGLVAALRSDLRRMTVDERAVVEVTDLWPRRRRVATSERDHPG